MREALAFERVGIARYARCESLLDRMPNNSATTGTGSRIDPARWVRALVDLRVARLLAYRAVSLQDDPSAGAAASAARIATTTCDQQVAELLFDVLGPAALDSGVSARAARGGRRPLALRTGRHRGIGNHRGTADAGRTRRLGDHG